MKEECRAVRGKSNEPLRCRRTRRTGGPPDVQVHDSNGVGAPRREAHPGLPEGKKSRPVVVVIAGLLCNYPAAAT